jgi:hypothetical protein
MRDRGGHHQGYVHSCSQHNYHNTSIIKGMHMQGLCVSKLFEHLANVGTQKLHQNLRRQWCTSHIERHAHYCTQGFRKGNLSTSLKQ